MIAIDEIHEFDRDWDWFVVDPEGHLGHFTTAGMRLLPESVKQDLEGLEALGEYFCDAAPCVGGARVREGIEYDCGYWKDLATKER